MLVSAKDRLFFCIGVIENVFKTWARINLKQKEAREDLLEKEC